ncbi:MAG: ATP-binding protein [Pseudomonadota bacterium]
MQFLSAGTQVPHAMGAAMDPVVMSVHAVSNVLIALAYFSIPLAFALFLRRRPGFAHTRLVLLFGAFILLCGLSHAVHVLAMFHPLHALEGGLKALTALVAIATASALFLLLPQLVAIPGSRALIEMNARLEAEVAERRAAEAALRESKHSVEREVEMRTRELQESELRYKLAVDGSYEGIWDWNISSNTVVFSDRNRDLLGLTREEFPDAFDSWASRVHPDDLPMILGAVTKHIEDGTPYEGRYRIVAKDGSYRWWRSRGQATWNEKGEPIRMLGINRDVTEEKLREDELRAAQERAQAASVAKSAFLASMSHEIRTPMNGIIGMAELLAETELTEEQRISTETIVLSGERLLTIINDVLDFSKIEAGKLAFASVSFDISEEVEGVCALLISNAREKNIDLLLDCHPSLHRRVVGDPGRLRQIVTNLVGNAIKFTDTGHVFVRVDGQQRDGRCDFEIVVEDTGIGIEPEKQGSIFSAFEQALTPRHVGIEGTGLGLAISRRIAEAMSGTLEVVSEPGKGSTFTCRVSLPLDEAAAAPACAVALEPPGPESEAVVVVSLRPIHQAKMARALSFWGLRCVAAGTLEEAAELVRALARPPRAVTVDHRTLSPDGLPESARALLRLAEDTPLIAMMPPDFSYDRETLFAAGFSDLLAEPPRMSLLHATLFGAAAEASAAPAPPKARLAADGEGRVAAPGIDPSLAPIGGPGKGGAEVLSGAIILVAEDNRTNRLVIDRLLAKSVGSLAFAEDGREAVELFASLRPNIVLMDMLMPEMNGTDATLAIRAAEAANGWPRCPIVALTANALPGDRARCLGSGMDDFLTKPVRKELLISCIAGWIDSRQPGETAPEDTGRPGSDASPPRPEAGIDAGTEVEPEVGTDAGTEADWAAVSEPPRMASSGSGRDPGRR